jgi:hypothetical protein
MKSLPLAGAVALCAALLVTGCAKKTTDQSSATSSTDTTQAAGATPAADATPAVDAAATTAPAASGYIDIPVYPGVAEKTDQGLTASGNGVSVTTKVYKSKDDAKRVSEWYKSHLPASWKNSIITVGGKTGGTFVDEHTDGDQSVMVTSDDDGSSRIQLTTKHGK